MVKLFVGNLGDTNTVTSNDLREQFERYGSVTECERVKNYAFVHMDDRNAAEKALQELNGTSIKGIYIDQGYFRGCTQINNFISAYI